MDDYTSMMKAFFPETRFIVYAYPMDRAPRDGTEIVLLVAERPILARYIDGVWVSSDGLIVEPEGWLNLPTISTVNDTHEVEANEIITEGEEETDPSQQTPTQREITRIANMIQESHDLDADILTDENIVSVNKLRSLSARMRILAKRCLTILHKQETIDYGISSLKKEVANLKDELEAERDLKDFASNADKPSKPAKNDIW